jgi:hypothetical protein
MTAQEEQEVEAATAVVAVIVAAAGGVTRGGERFETFTGTIFLNNQPFKNGFDTQHFRSHHSTSANRG